MVLLVVLFWGWFDVWIRLTSCLLPLKSSFLFLHSLRRLAMSWGRLRPGRSLVRTLEGNVAGPVMCRLRTWWLPRERLRRAMNWTDLGAAIVVLWKLGCFGRGEVVS